MKITGRQARPRKTNGRHRQAEDLRSLSWAGQAYFWRPAWTSVVYSLFEYTKKICLKFYSNFFRWIKPPLITTEFYSVPIPSPLVNRYLNRREKLSLP